MKSLSGLLALGVSVSAFSFASAVIEPDEIVAAPDFVAVDR
jgi:hypothetical protein